MSRSRSLFDSQQVARIGSMVQKFGLEGLTIMADGTTWIVTDNDGVDGSSGETQLLSLGALFE